MTKNIFLKICFVFFLVSTLLILFSNVIVLASNYISTGDAALMIWDNTDPDSSLYNANLTKYVNQEIEFFANYTNQSDGSSIIDADCSILFSDNDSQSFTMNYDGVVGVYTYKKTFDVNNTYYYNVTCIASGFSTINLTNNILVDVAGDLAIGVGDITFSQQNPLENEEIIIYATIHSLVDYNYTDVLVRFYDGNPLIDGLLINDVYINTTGTEDVNINTTWSSKVGTHNIYVWIDPSNAVNDLNRSNNNKYNFTFTPVWQIYYGKMISTTTNLGSGNNSVINWAFTNMAPINIYVTSPDSNINWASLKAITRSSDDIQDENTLNDFTDIDISLGIENFTDSINATYSIGGYPIGVNDYNVYNTLVKDVPESMSTNNTNFYTGILWDTSDTASLYYFYDSTPGSRSDIIFVTRVNYDKIGAYGTYDYELRVPAFLRNYKGDNGIVQFYYEIQ